LTKVLHDVVDLSEEFAFLCEIPGWNNATYVENVHASRQAEPYYQPYNAQLQLPLPVAHAHLARRKAFIENVQGEVDASQQLSLTTQMSSMNVAGNRASEARVNHGYMRDFWSTGTIQDQSKVLTSATAQEEIVSEVPKIPTNFSVSAESDADESSDGSESYDGSESEEWMTCYRHCFFGEVGGSVFGIYYETFGGGPHGGYVETPELNVFKVSRNWFETWKTQKLPSNICLRSVNARTPMLLHLNVA
jgi:hypothetical protein